MKSERITHALTTAITVVVVIAVMLMPVLTYAVVETFAQEHKTCEALNELRTEFVSSIDNAVARSSNFQKATDSSPTSSQSQKDTAAANLAALQSVADAAHDGIKNRQC